MSRFWKWSFYYSNERSRIGLSSIRIITQKNSSSQENNTRETGRREESTSSDLTSSDHHSSGPPKGLMPSKFAPGTVRLNMFGSPR
ncbi:unnamed protein product [Adineta steineri]|uniref:Uncharacterized protein n=1 Tax=Adineta steineri TaxID=433720 RepID=A0A815ML63_9BILA|nr:unnamed protein product [Adineta steineri]CAF1622574.1 unnamed protein product [Adineta steineri]